MRRDRGGSPPKELQIVNKGCMVFYCSSFFRFNKPVCLADCVPSKTKEHGKETQDRTAPTRHHSHTSRAVPGLLSSRTRSKDISYLQRHLQPVPRFHDTADHYRAGDSRHCRYRKGRREVAAGYSSDCLRRHDSGRRSVLCDRDMAVPFDDRFDGRQYAAYKATELAPYFSITIPAMIDVMSSLVFSFIVGLSIAYGGLRTMENLFNEFKTVIEKVIEKAIIPLLPLYIFGVFLNMTHNGQARQVLLVFSQIILVILVLHVFILVYAVDDAARLSDGIGDQLIGSDHPSDIEADREERRKQGGGRLCRPALRYDPSQRQCDEDYGVCLDNLPVDRSAAQFRSLRLLHPHACHYHGGGPRCPGRCHHGSPGSPVEHPGF